MTNHTMIHRIYSIAMGALTIMSAAAARVSFPGVGNLTSGRVASDYVVTMEINPADIKPGRDREMIITPVLRSADGLDSIVMPAVRVSGRNRYFSHLRNHDLPAGERMLEAGKGSPLSYRFETPWQPWMNQSDLDFDRSTCNCCDAPVDHGSQLIARHDYRDPSMPLAPLYIALTGDSTIVIEAQGQAFVDFVVNRTELKPDYRGNRAEIDKIIKSVDVVAQDPDAIITRITIKGYASPEGSYSNNVRLAMGRTKTLKDYVSADLQRRYAGFDPDVMFTDYEPEDWDGLRRWLETHGIAHRDEILAIASDLSLEPDPRNSKIQNLYPEEYKYILAEVYPALRHSDYTIRYSIRTGIDVEHLKEMMESTPERLRPVDYYMIASTYTVGSPEYDRVMLMAASQYPGDAEAAINAANIYLAQDDLKGAGPFIARCGQSPQALYTRANMAARQGDLPRALSLLEAASAKGLDEATRAIPSVRALLDRDPVTYY